MLEVDEGLRLKPYRCTAGKITIGIGRNLEDVGISKETALSMLDEDIISAEHTCHNLLGPEFATWGENRKLGWVNIAFNLGANSLSKFRNTIAAAKKNDWSSVRENLKSSLWYKQVGKRAERVISMICDEKYPYDS